MGKILSEEDKETVRLKAKKIMDDFMSALSDAEDISTDFGSERNKDTRDFFDNKYDDEFRERFLKNAKNVDDNQIVSERKKW